jgi:hypothetical protein
MSLRACVLAALAMSLATTACDGGSGSTDTVAAASTSGSGSGSAGTGAAATTSASGGASSGMGSTSSDAGQSIDLSRWELQEPVGSPGAPTTISSAMLQAGYHDAYFFTDPSDGALTFWDPENGVTTANSSYPRSELRELDATGAGANWAVMGQSVLSATVEVVQVPDHVCVGQIHIGSALYAGLAASTKPLLELYYHANGDVVVGIEASPSGGSQTDTTLGNVPLGTRFTYVIALTGDGTGNGTIAITVNGSQQTFPMPSGFVGYGEYFKAGDYDQSAGTDPTVGATVKFFALSVSHA